MGALELSAGNVVLTGGASLMPGVEQLAADRFRLPVRTGAPHGVSGLTDVVSGPAHATAVGLVRYGMAHQRDPAAPAAGRARAASGGGVLTRIRDILKDFF
jgi:cell division protein FtsA